MISLKGFDAMTQVAESIRAIVCEQLEKIFPSRSSQGAVVQRFEDGISNENFLVTYSNGYKIAFRMVGKGAEGMVDRLDEKYNTSVGVRLGITPEVLWFDECSGMKVTRFIADAETLHNDSIQTDENLAKVAAVMRKLHTSKCRLHKDFNVFTEILRYEQLLACAKGEMYEGYAEVREQVLALEDELSVMGMDVTACHCDTLPENWIKDGAGKVWLLDWEYSGMNDPFWDIAAPFIEANFAKERESYFLNAYFDGTVPSTAERKVLIYKILMDYLWSIWARVKELDGDEGLRDYGLMRLSRGISNLSKL